MPDEKHNHDIPDIFFEMSPEEILERCLTLLTPLNHEEIKSTIATGHNVVILDSDNFAHSRHFLSEFLRALRQVKDDEVPPETKT